MKNPKIDIYKTLLVNRTVVFALAATFISAAVIFGISLNRLYKKQLNTILVINAAGEVVPVKWMNRDESIKIEIKDHLEKFANNFYDYDSWDIDKKLAKALWLGDKSVEQLYIKRKNDGWYSKIKLFNIKQSIDIDPQDMEVTGNKEPYSFRVKINMAITQDGVTENYSFQIQGQIIFVSRNYPLNPHGLLITNFLETNRTKL